MFNHCIQCDQNQPPHPWNPSGFERYRKKLQVQKAQKKVPSYITIMSFNYLIYLLTAIGLTSGGSSTVCIYTQTIHTTTQLTTLVGRLSGIQTQSGQTKINDA